MSAAMAAALLSLAGCSKVETACEKEHLPEVAPTVSLQKGEATVESLSFVLSSENAASVRYSVYETGAALPSAEALFDISSDAAGIPADAEVSDEYTISGLELGTDYTIVAAAHNNVGYSELVTLDMTTVTPELKLNLSLASVTSNQAVITLSPVNASKVAYLCLESAAEMPEAAYILENGVEADASAEGSYVVKGLEPESSYFIAAAALDLAGKGNVVAGPVDVRTTAIVPPAVGDYYYSDGTWSTEFDDTKEPVGIVFYTGVATEFGDNQAYYKVKDGSGPIEDFHGYVVALKDASPEEGVWWSFYDSWADPTGVSLELEDFLGYTNTIAIKNSALRLGVGFSESNDSYPAAYYATVVYDSMCPAPEKSSGWFLPSAGQLQYIWDQVYFNTSGNLKGWLEQSFRNLGDKAAEMHARDSEYWSSCEQVDSYATSVRAYYVCFDSSNFKPGFTAWYNKDTNFRVRSVLAF